MFSYQSCIFSCTNDIELECFERGILGTNEIYSEKVYKIKKGYCLFLLNTDKDILYGPFLAISDGNKDIDVNAFNGKFPYQVKIISRSLENQNFLENAEKTLKELNIDWKNEILDTKKTDILIRLLKEKIQ